MNPAKFNKLIDNLTQHYDSADCVDLRCGDSIVIYGWRHDNFKLQIEYFDGLPTQHQKNIMQAKINAGISSLDGYFFEKEEKFIDIPDEYFYNGVNRENFN